MVLLALFASWAAYRQLTPQQQAAVDADRWLPTHETIRLLAAWHLHPPCPECGRWVDQPGRYCTIGCARQAGYRNQRAVHSTYHKRRPRLHL